MIVLILLSEVVLSQEPYHLKLLAVQEDQHTYKGSDADLYLELKEGSGRVFLDTFPATKIDTQISTRFSKEIACNHFKLNCNKYDFIYTIKAKSNIIGGPSAGAAIAALTTIAVLDLAYDEGVAVTGTINSGGVVGPVGGVKEKLQAASAVGLKKVLIPKGTEEIGLSSAASVSENETGNQTMPVANESALPLNLVTYARENLSLETIEVTNLDEVVYHLTGIDLNHKTIVIEEEPQYKKIMGTLQNVLCQRVEKIEQELKQVGIVLNESILEPIDSKKRSADNATKQEDFYSAASYCFGINIQLKLQFYREEAPSYAVMQELFNSLGGKVAALETKLSQQKVETISDLQTVMIVKERLNDVKEQLTKFVEMPPENLEEMYALLSYSEERYFSAVAWMEFFAMDGRKVPIDRDVLKNSCLQKISEAEERYQYLSLFLGGQMATTIQEKINSAKAASGQDESELCLMKAIQAKGDSNAVLSSMGVREDALAEYLDSKIKAVQIVIADNSAQGTFPILGYSYYQYANSLREKEKYTALIYLEYALEMSDLGIYFPAEKVFLERVEQKLDVDELIIFAEGLAVGIFVVLFFRWMKPALFPKKRKRRRK